MIRAVAGYYTRCVDRVPGAGAHAMGGPSLTVRPCMWYVHNPLFA
jgi:hypothetical protein